VSIATVSRGKHTAAYRIADLEAQLAQASADNQALIGANEDLVCELTRAVIRSCQDEMRIAVAEEENGRLKARVKELSDKVIRGAAEHARLRQAVINARPRITKVDTQLVRPYAPAVVLPYVSPVPYRDSSSEQTQQLPILDLPQPAAT
jgi:hypothetical protein